MVLVYGSVEELDPMRATFDHVIPRARGGRGFFHNLKAAHSKCNKERLWRFPETLESSSHLPITKRARRRILAKLSNVKFMVMNTINRIESLSAL